MLFLVVAIILISISYERREDKPEKRGGKKIAENASLSSFLKAVI